MGDIQQILGIAPASTSAPINPHTSITTTTALAAFTAPAPTLIKSTKPPRGVSREVFNLLATTTTDTDPNAALPMLVPSNALEMKSRGSTATGAHMVDGKPSAWVWAPFSSTARNDGAMFMHWVKKGVEYPDYPFARFNVFLDPVEFSEEEYLNYLQTPNWTRSDTDQLMGLCRRFDLRWAVIADRYTATPDRNIDELQVRR